MRRKLILLNVISILVSMLVILLVSILVVVEGNNKRAEETLRDNLRVCVRLFDGTNADSVVDVMKSSSKNVRVTIVAGDGEVLADSFIYDELENHLNRDEIRNVGTIFVRYSKSLGEDMMYLAASDEGCFVRCSIPQYKISEGYVSLIVFECLAIVMTLVCSIVIVNKYSKKVFMPLNDQLNRFSSIVGSSAITSAFDEEALSLQIDRVYELIEDKIDEIESQKDKILFIINNSKNGFLLIDGDSNVELINVEAMRIFSTQKDLTNKSYIYVVRNVEVQKLIEDAIKGRTDVFGEVSYNNRYYKVFINFFVVGYRDYVSVFLVDETHEHNMSVMKKEFFDNASHELKSPLTTIIGYQQLIENGILSTDEEIRDANRHTIKEAARMNEIIKDMLDLSKLESDTYNPDSSSLLSVRECINSCIDSKVRQIEEKKIRVTTDLDGTMVGMRQCDLNRLIINLLDNAIKYNKEGGSIDITLKYSTLYVSDSGIGISEENIARIFERFFRVDKGVSKELGGTGLGLAIVKHICLLYGFKIEVTSTLGVGTTFKIVFREQ